MMEYTGDSSCPTTDSKLESAHQELEQSISVLSQKYIQHKHEIKTEIEDIETIKNNQQKFKAEVVHFNKLIEENSDKRTRTLKKIEKDEKLEKKLNEKCLNLQREIQDLESLEEKLEQLISEFTIYEEYLLDVMNFSDFNDISEILKKYNGLSDAGKTLQLHQENHISNIENSHIDINNLLQVKEMRLSVLKKEHAALQKKCDELCKSLVINKEINDNIHASAKEKQNILQQVSSAAHNLCKQMCQGPSKYENNDMDKRFTIIKNNLLRTSKIVDIVKICMEKAEETDAEIDVRAVVVKNLM